MRTALKFMPQDIWLDSLENSACVCFFFGCVEVSILFEN